MTDLDTLSGNVIAWGIAAAAGIATAYPPSSTATASTLMSTRRRRVLTDLVVTVLVVTVTSGGRPAWGRDQSHMVICVDLSAIYRRDRRELLHGVEPYQVVQPVPGPAG